MARWFRESRVSSRTDARVLTEGDLMAAARLCAQDPVATVLAASHVVEALAQGLQGCGGELWGYPRDGPLEAVCWAGANLVPVVPAGTPTIPALRAFAALVLGRGRRCSSIVGPDVLTLALWHLLEDSWPAARDVRVDQPSMAIWGAPSVRSDTAVHVATVEDLAVVLPASVAMFTEEVGYSPITAGGAGYTARVRSLLEQGRTFARIDPVASLHGAPVDKVVFKADLGALTSSVAQVQGVWVDPAFRGEGRSETGMAAVVEQTLRRVPCVSLYVNAYNTPAIASYERVGFERVGTYATVLF